MLAEIYSGALTGIEAYAVSFELNAGHGEPRTVVVGLPDAAVGEYRSGWTALLHSGFEPPKGRTTINLAPANRRKEGPCFDLPIALGILAATDALRLEGLDRIWWQRLRFERVQEVFCNAQMPSRLMASVCRMEPEAEGLLRAAMHDLHLSARAYDRILKVARTVADLAEAEWIGSVHVAEAVGYRLLDRPFRRD